MLLLLETQAATQQQSPRRRNPEPSANHSRARLDHMTTLKEDQSLEDHEVALTDWSSAVLQLNLGTGSADPVELVFERDLGRRSETV